MPLVLVFLALTLRVQQYVRQQEEVPLLRIVVIDLLDLALTDESPADTQQINLRGSVRYASSLVSSCVFSLCLLLSGILPLLSLTPYPSLFLIP